MSRGKLFSLIAAGLVAGVVLFVLVFVQSCHNDTPTTPVEDAEAAAWVFSGRFAALPA